VKYDHLIVRNCGSIDCCYEDEGLEAIVCILYYYTTRYDRIR